MTDTQLAELLTLRCEVDQLGTIRYFNSEGLLHRQHGPAQMGISHEGWFCDGKLHRVGGPAYTYTEKYGGRTVSAWYTHGQHQRSERSER